MDKYKIALVIVLSVMTVLGYLVSFTLFVDLMFIILKQIHADQTTWVLFWIYVPVSVLSVICSTVITKLAKDVTG